KKILAEFHSSTPLARGMEMESLRSQLSFSFSPKIFRAVTDKLSTEGVAVRDDSLVRLPSHRVKLNEDEQGTPARVEQLLQTAELAPPEVKELEEKLHVPRKLLADLLGVLESRGQVIKVTTDLYFSSSVLEKARTTLADHLAAHGEITAAAFRDLLG